MHLDPSWLTNIWPLSRLLGEILGTPGVKVVSESGLKSSVRNGKSFSRQEGVMEGFPQIVAAALRAEWGSSPSARKAVGLITHANERTVRNWFDGRNGPSGENLVTLIRHSDAVFEGVLLMSKRRPALTTLRAEALRENLRGLLALLDETLSP